MNNKQFAKLCSRGWSVPVLASISAGCPARVSPLAAKLATGRNTITQTVLHLQEMGVLEQAEGHGHPLRPEFSLTPLGKRVADWSHSISLAVDAPDQLAVLRKSWSLPIMRLLEYEQRYGALRKALIPVTDRALSLSLGRLTEHNWVERHVLANVRPPQVAYRAGVFGMRVMPQLLESYDL